MDALIAAAKKIRRKELAVDLWQVRQHPLNQYPPGHPHHVQHYPCPHDTRVLFGERDEMSARFKALWDTLTQATPDVTPGSTGIWCVMSFLYLPCRVVDAQHGFFGGYIERLDDPDVEPGGPRKAHYRVMDWREVRLYPSSMVG